MMLTFMRRASRRKPMPAVRFSRPRSERTTERMMTSFSRPWKPSTELTSMRPPRAAPSVSTSSRRMARTCALYGEMTPIDCGETCSSE